MHDDAKRRGIAAAETVSATDAPSFPVLGERSQEVLAAARAFAQQDETILISGPSGAGKSRLAEFCHTSSPRAHGPFQLVDLLGIPEDMQMAELFGWRRGAFTGAVKDHEGFVASTHGGTLFLDEIDKLSLRTQAGLLQFMESRRFRSLGDSSGTRSANVRLIVATNTNLRERVAQGLFREDLYFRISVLPIHVPPLDERRDEIVAWAKFMLERSHRRSGAGQAVELDTSAAQALERAHWPGNLRQLDNVVRRAYALARATHQAGSVLIVRLHHVEQALGFDPPLVVERPLLAELRRAADEVVTHALTTQSSRKLDLEDARAFEGLVLEAALQRLGDLAEVYRLFGGVSLVERRNHHRHYRRELTRVARLEQALEVRPSSLSKQSIK